MSRFNKKTNKRPDRSEKQMNENGIGSNYYTIDTNPISFFSDDRVGIDMYPTAWGKYGVEITCPDLKYDSGLRQFSSEEEATLFARNQYSALINKLNVNEAIIDRVMQRLLENTIRN